MVTTVSFTAFEAFIRQSAVSGVEIKLKLLLAKPVRRICVIHSGENKDCRLRLLADIYLILSLSFFDRIADAL
jgi:hypothetical protein